MTQNRVWVNPQTRQNQDINNPQNQAIAPLRDKFSEERMACLELAELPADLTREQLNIAKDYAIRSGQRIPSNVEQSAFYWYYMGSNWEEISTKINIPMPMLIYSALYYKWHQRKKTVTSVRAGEKITRADAAAIDLITDAIVATAAIYKSQLTKVVTNPEAAKECALIPKNFKELELLLKMMQSLQTKEIASGEKASGTSSVVNVNIANLTGEPKHRHISATETHQDAIEAGDNEDERLEVLRLLERSRI